MKTQKIIRYISYVLLVIGIISISCEDAGVTKNKLSGNEENLPEELKGLKVYSVSIGDGNFVKVAILNENVNSITYPVGKTLQSTIIVNKKDNKLIEVKEILIENDSLIVCRK